MKLNEDALTPLYKQITDVLKADIQSGRYHTGDKIPSEAELSQIYSVSRITVRRAVEDLANEGYLTKRQGKGTFVNPRKLARKICPESNVQSFTEACRADGREASAHVLTRDVVAPSQEAREFLQLGDSDELVYVKRVRCADGIPIMLENNYFPTDRFAFMLSEELEDVSEFELIKKHLDLTPSATALCTLEIVLANAEKADALQVAVGDPLFYEDNYFLDEYGNPLFLGQQYIAGSRYIFNI